MKNSTMVCARNDSRGWVSRANAPHEEPLFISLEKPNNIGKLGGAESLTWLVKRGRGTSVYACSTPSNLSEDEHSVNEAQVEPLESWMEGYHYDSDVDPDSEECEYSFQGNCIDTVDKWVDLVIDFVHCEDAVEWPQAEPHQVLQELESAPLPPEPRKKSSPHHQATPVAANGTVHAKGLGLVIKTPQAPLEEESWYPGFSRQLGARGRCAVLDLVRKVYRQDPEHYKAILQSRTPPASISSLPFFNIPMLWELSYQFGIFAQALQVSKAYQPASLKRRLAHAASGEQSQSSSGSLAHSRRRRSAKSPELVSENSLSSDNDLKTQSGRFIKRSKRFGEYAVMETPTRTKAQDQEGHVFLTTKTESVPQTNGQGVLSLAEVHQDCGASRYSVMQSLAPAAPNTIETSG